MDVADRRNFQFIFRDCAGLIGEQEFYRAETFQGRKPFYDDSVLREREGLAGQNNSLDERQYFRHDSDQHRNGENKKVGERVFMENKDEERHRDDKRQNGDYKNIFYDLFGKNRKTAPLFY